MVRKFSEENTELLIDCDSDSDSEDFYELIECDEDTENTMESKTPYKDHVRQIQKNTGVSYNFAIKIAKTTYKKWK